MGIWIAVLGRLTLLALILVLFSEIGMAAERDEVHTPVPVVQPGRMDVAAAPGGAEVPVAVSRDWTRRQDDVTRAIIVIHGWPRRDLGAGEHAAQVAGSIARGSIVITPQFLTPTDIAAHQLPSNVLGWGENDWQKGEPSKDSAAISSFQVVDAIFRRLADRAIFPNLNVIVLAGHSAGGQFVQRYAAVGRGEAELGRATIHVRYVVANPASYLYLTDDRMTAHGTFAPFDAAACPGFDDWPYGLRNGAPPYVSPRSSTDMLKAGYLQRDVVYLLGAADNDPRADGLDRSCAGEAQSTSRLAGGLAYDAYVHMLDPNTQQHVVTVPGVGHKSYAMFASACGLSVLFDKAGCDSALNLPSKPNP